jgi:hypothetical protein
LDEINNVYNNRLQMPVLKQSTPAKGIFFKFSGFSRKTSPASLNSDIKKSDLSDEVYIVNNGKEESNRKIWGFCDSSGLYISVRYKCFQGHSATKYF